MTQIFASYPEFLQREDKKANGVSKEFAEENKNYEAGNTTNEGCWNCSYCRGCRGCSDCRNKQNISGEKDNNFIDPSTVKIENIHQKILEIIHDNGNQLNMSTWHTCDTTHCRGGWVTHLAGKEGAELEFRFGMPLAAHIIYKNSSTIPVRWNQYYLNNDDAMKDIVRCAEEEKALGK